jgi:hypothetical protein
MRVALFLKQTRRRFAQISADQKSDQRLSAESAAKGFSGRDGANQTFIVTIKNGAARYLISK